MENMEDAGKIHIETEEEKRFKSCCSTCRYVREKYCELSKESKYLLCCKNAPSTSGFPVVEIDDWCNEHKFWENELNG